MRVLLLFTIIKSSFIVLLLGDEVQEVCYGELGCFSLGEPWSSGKRPIPLPQGPEEVTVNFYLYTRVKPQERYTIATWPSIRLEDSSYNGTEVTVFYVHGWSQTANDSRLDDLKDAILFNMNANVIFADWGSTAHIPYPQAVSNTRIISAQILRLCRHLIKKKGSAASRLHLIGISLGAHIAAYVAKQIPGVYRLTGLDPAQPLFHSNNKKLKLNKDDATFVEVIHTNGRPTLPLLGLGIYQRLGDVDFYFNGGWDQPGCANDGNRRVIAELESGNYNLSEDLHLRVFCPHVRSLLYYVEAIKNPDCKFWGIKRSQSRTILSILSGGWLSRYLVSLRKCTIDTCIPVGIATVEYPARGAFDVATSNSVPYCIKHPTVNEKMAEQLADYEHKTTL